MAQELYLLLPQQVARAHSLRPRSTVVHTTHHSFMKLQLSKELLDLQHDHQATYNAFQQVISSFTPLDLPKQQPLPYPAPLA